MLFLPTVSSGVVVLSVLLFLQDLRALQHPPHTYPQPLTFTGWRRPFKLEVGAQPAGQDFISNQGVAREAAVPNDVT